MTVLSHQVGMDAPEATRKADDTFSLRRGCLLDLGISLREGFRAQGSSISQFNKPARLNSERNSSVIPQENAHGPRGPSPAFSNRLRRKGGGCRAESL